MADAPAQPKKPAGGAYGQFSNEKRKEFTELCKGKPVSEVSKMCSVEWKKLTPEQQAPYQQKYEAAKKKFDEDMAAFLAAGGVKQKGATALRAEKRKAKAGKKKKEKDPNAPKKPVGGAYGCFLAKHREAITKECAGKAATEVSKVAGERWKKLSAAEKEPFEKEYAAKSEEYKKAMESYVPPAKEEDEEDDEDEDEEEGDEDEEAAESPAKKAKTDKAAEKAEKANQKAEAKAAKAEAKAKPKGKAKAKAKDEPSVNIPKDVLAKAEKADMVGNLKKLLTSDDIKSAGISASKAFDVLSEKKGLFHNAKRALLGA